MWRALASHQLQCCPSLTLVKCHLKSYLTADRHYRRLIHNCRTLCLWVGTSQHRQQRRHSVILLGTRRDHSALCRRSSPPCRATTTSSRIPKLMVSIAKYVAFTVRRYAGAVCTIALCLCLCVSQVSVLPKRLNIGSNKQHYTIAQGV